MAVVLLVGLFFLIKPKKSAQDLPNNSNQNTTTNSNTISASKNKTFELVVKNRKVVSGADLLKADEGDTVIIKVTVDEPEEFHLHGYDKSLVLEKDKQGELSFVANFTGRFPFELEKSKTELGVLEVSPKQ